MSAWLRLGAFLFLAAIGFWIWLTLFPSPERVIHHRLDKLAADASFAPNQGYLARLAHAQALDGFFSTNVELALDIPGFEEHRSINRQEIVQAALGAQASTRGLSAKFPDVQIVLANDKHSAIADVTLVAYVSGEKDAIVQELKFAFELSDGKWLIHRVETVRSLSN